MAGGISHKGQGSLLSLAYSGAVWGIQGGLHEEWAFRLKAGGATIRQVGEGMTWLARTSCGKGPDSWLAQNGQQGGVEKVGRGTA